MMKKLIKNKSLIALSLSALLLAGCGQDGTDGS